MRQIILTFIIVCVGIIIHADTTQNALTVLAKDGTKVSYALSERPKVTFSGDDLIITSGDNEVRYPLSQMSRFTFELTTGIDMVDAEGSNITPFEFNGDTLLFPAIDKNCQVLIYATDGKLMISRDVKSGTILRIPLNSLNSGIYLVNVSGITYKIVKR